MAVALNFIGDSDIEPVVIPTKNWNNNIENLFMRGDNFKTTLAGGRKILVNTSAITHIVITED